MLNLATLKTAALKTAVLKATPIALYLGVAVLAALQYMGENAIGFPESVGLMVEELTEPDFATTSAR